MDLNKRVIISLLFFLLSFGALASGFCEGFKEGYKAGYCHNDSFCLPPLPPLCPLPGLGETSFQDGYNRGFLSGLSNKR